MDLKHGYKQTEIGTIPQEWECLRLETEIREMTDFVAAGSFESLRNNVHVFDAPQFAIYVRLFDLRLGLCHAAQKYVDEVSYKFLAKSNLFGNEILVANIGANVGEVFLMPPNMGPATIAPNMIVVRPNNEKMRFDFLYYYITSGFGQERMRELIAGSGHPKINKTDLKKLKLLVPPLSEQRTIAAALSDVDALLGGLDRLIAKKRDLKQAAMQQLLTGQTRLPGFHGEWGGKRLGDVASIDPENLGSDTSASFAFNYIALEDVDRGSLSSRSEQVFASAPSRARRRLRAHDVLVSTVRPNLQSHLLFRGGLGEWVCSTGFCVLRCQEGVANPAYVFSHLFTDSVSRQIDALLTGSNYPAINSGDVRALEIPMPDHAEQTAIAAVLSDMDAELSALEAQRDKTRALKQGMMQELLTGRTRLVAPSSNVVPVNFTGNLKPARSLQRASNSHNWQINEAVVLAVLVKKFGDEEHPLGRMRRTKLIYLLHRHVEHVAEGYVKKAAGPYNSNVKYRGPEGIAQKNGYIRAHRSGKLSGFVAAERIAEAEDYFAKWYGHDVLAWLEQFRFQSNDELELLTTVDMAAEDLKRATPRVDVDGIKAVIGDHPEWQAKLERAFFSDVNIAGALSRTRELFPTVDPREETRPHR